ncbi:5-oxoprolinase [Haloferula helveola]|uniref:5-oxoprolinase n=1 Tax=Haloferula helveola TaxID=490095 RepID=A0ABN6H9Q1_9BACT|nr:5-oxoprolinase [Haloferula helveola]
MSARWRVRVDTGGTFTDAWAIGPDGEERRCKVLSDGRLRVRLGELRNGRRPLEGPAAELPDGLLVGWRTEDGRTVVVHESGALELPGNGGMVELDGGEEAPVVAARILTRTASGVRLPSMDFRVATTRGTNALLERKGADVALFVTEGFEDLTLIGDQRRERLFELKQPPADRLARTIYGVSSRLSADGAQLVPPDRSQIAEVARRALDSGCRVAAVALLHSWRDAHHEKLVGRWLIEEGFEQVTLSSEVAPLIRLLPRTETALADAFLAPVMRHFIRRVTEPLGDQSAWLMTSAGGLVPADRYHPKDSLLSGPAGGLIGAAELARAAGYPKVLTFDMGGTSTDVARIDGPFRYREEQRIGPARVMAPALEIETVAAGGGSICEWRNGRLEVGPESAGSDPGPACYGRGGPLTLTDVNLLLGLMDADKAGIPLDVGASRARFRELVAEMERSGEDVGDPDGLLAGIREVAIEKMAEAIRSVSVRDGVEVEDYALLAFGGAGPQHACAIADRLGVRSVLVPADAGLLSAWGLERAVRQEQRVRQVLLPLGTGGLDGLWQDIAGEATEALGGSGPVLRWIASLRLQGQDSTIEVESEDGATAALGERFGESYRRIFGYDPAAGSMIEVVSLRVVAEESANALVEENFGPTGEPGPQLRQDRFSTCVVPAGWTSRSGDRGTLLLERNQPLEQADISGESAVVRAGLFRSRFEGILGAMGEQLKRTALSTNVKERLDYSCALLDADGRLVASAPHVPVHLGALGVCVRECLKRLEPGPSDVIITNHPGAGGSHLPDITLIAPVHDPSGRRIGFVANRAHHAELGGMAPGSMPAAATKLSEEGVVIPPMLLVENGAARWDRLDALLREASYPSRRPDDNLADLAAQLASCHLGRTSIAGLARDQGGDVVRDELRGIVERSAELMGSVLGERDFNVEAEDALDDGTPLRVSVRVRSGRMEVDFCGTGPVHPGNLNATPAIVRSVLLYVLRLWVADDIPLNEGLLGPVDLILPGGILNPEFPARAEHAPAVVGGNVETSQRIADLLCEALGLSANGPGTMNNFLFGDETFGYYETLGGGSGAGPGFDGTSGKQVHMTNTAITDPEILEHRYPVRLIRHALRRGSGGEGCSCGGDGVVREVEFLRPLTVSFLTQRRAIGPRGGAGGASGKPGCQVRITAQGETRELPGICTEEFEVGDRVRIETPGGGGWGAV